MYGMTCPPNEPNTPNGTQARPNNQDDIYIQPVHWNQANGASPAVLHAEAIFFGLLRPAANRAPGCASSWTACGCSWRASDLDDHDRVRIQREIEDRRDSCQRPGTGTTRVGWPSVFVSCGLLDART